MPGMRLKNPAYAMSVSRAIQNESCHLYGETSKAAYEEWARDQFEHIHTAFNGDIFFSITGQLVNRGTKRLYEVPIGSPFILTCTKNLEDDECRFWFRDLIAYMALSALLAATGKNAVNGHRDKIDMASHYLKSMVFCTDVLGTWLTLDENWSWVGVEVEWYPLGMLGYITDHECVPRRVLGYWGLMRRHEPSQTRQEFLNFHAFPSSKKEYQMKKICFQWGTGYIC